jgi:DNA-binding transcriptional ArsR family regulator
VNKRKDARIHEAQGQKSRQIASLNVLHVLEILGEKPSSFSELLRETGFSKPVLSKHLQTLTKERAIYKDTIKSDETSDPREVGKIVYRHRKSDGLVETLMMGYMKFALKMPKPEWDEQSKAKFEVCLREMMKVWSEADEKIRINKHVKQKGK